MSGPDLKKLIAIAAACLAVAHAGAQQAPLPLPAEIDATKPGTPKGEGNAQKAAEEARLEAIHRAALKKCDDLKSAEKAACAARADAEKARGGANSDAPLPDAPSAAPPSGQPPTRSTK
ncbi:hypothetical protein [Variovorax sp. W6]|uniref:hypothetical protein n=1 Tax=Variovorax sp. W6 TaxID=3093895 RepID=UPI003D802FDB